MQAVEVTQQVLGRRRVEEAEARLRTAAAAGAVGTWDWNIPGGRMYADERLASFFGIDPERAEAGLPPEEYTRLVHEEDRARVEAAIAHTLETGDAYEIEYRVLGTDERIRWVLARGRVEYDEQGRPLRFPGALSDITARVEAERALRVAQQQITAAVSAGRIGIWTWDAASDRLVADAMLARLFALDVEEAARGVPLATVIDAIEEADRPAVEAAIARALESGEDFDAEFRVRDAAGNLRWVRGSGSPHRGEQGLRTGLVGVGVGDVVGKTIRQAFPGEAEDWLETYDAVLRTGEAIRFQRELSTQRRVLELYAFRVGDGHGRRVAVTFIGINPAERERIFEKFYRVDPDMHRGVPGTGLGLYICRELVQRMHGRIWVEQRAEGGSTFSFEIPAELP